MPRFLFGLGMEQVKASRDGQSSGCGVQNLCFFRLERLLTGALLSRGHFHFGVSVSLSLSWLTLEHKMLA